MKLFVVLAVVLFLMDPCRVRPRTLEFDQVREMCLSDHPSKFFKLTGSVIDKGDVICGDMPGGVHCSLYFGDEGRDGSVKLLVKAGRAEPGKTRYNGILFTPPAEWDGIRPVAVKFDSLALFDKDSAKVDLRNEKIAVAGTLRWDESTQICSQGNLYSIERVQ